jgi:uncharacterized iron-regulated membrane protein
VSATRMPDMPNAAVEREPSRRSVVAWRRWHRWIGLPAAIFLLWAGTTGTIVAATEFFGEDEALREQLRTVVSPVNVRSATAELTTTVERALATVAAQAPDAPVDKIVVQFKGPAPVVQVFTGKPGGGEDRQFVVNARTGALVKTESYVDKPFLWRLHSGEAFGDGGLVFAMGWGLALSTMTATGLVMLWRIRRRDATGVRRYFWR